MSSNWAFNLDMLAQNGVLDFDGASFVTGQAPRYVGRPMMPPSPYVGQVPPAPALKQPEIDEFKPQKQQLPKTEKEDNSYIHNPSWKKWIFGGLAIGGIVLAGFKAKSIINWAKNLFKGKNIKGKFNWKSVKDFVVDKAKNVKDFTVKYWNKFIGLFKSKKPKP